MHIDGGCHCGNITFEAQADPEKAVIYHCTDCQKMSGAPFNAVIEVPESDFKLTSGTLTMYVKTAESGNQRAQMFCPDCGSRIYATSVEDPPGGGPKILGVRLGSVNQREQVTPRRQIWHRSAQPWLSEIADIPSFDTTP